MRSQTYIFTDAGASWKQALFHLRGPDECSTVFGLHELPDAIVLNCEHSSAFLTWMRKQAQVLPVKIQHIATGPFAE
jgi:hypothetical protein